MSRILLTDDEGIISESLKHIIVTSLGGECDIRCVKAGKAVVEMAESFHPDITFVDIHMPGLSGIQAIQEIRKTNNEIIITVITTHDKFAYTEEAVNLGIMEYLTKPISNKKVILDVYMKAMQQMEKAKQKRSDNLEIRRRLGTVASTVKNGFIYSMPQDDGAADNSGYKGLLGIRDNYGFYLVLEFEDRDEGGRLIDAIGSNIKANKYYQDIGEIVKDYFPCIARPVMSNRVVLFVSSSEPMLKYKERMETITRTRTMLQKLEKHIGSDLRNGVGSAKTLGDAKELYGEALKAPQENISHVVHITNTPSRQGDVTGEHPKELENSYYKRGLKVDSEGVAACEAEPLSCIEGVYGCWEDMEAKVSELIMRLECRIHAKDGTEFGMKPRGNCIREIRDTSDSDKLHHWLLEETREICRYTGTEKRKEMEYLMDTVREYIDESYQKGVSLGEISRMANISPHYFSRLFEQGTGENFIEYLTKTGMRRACVCLQNPDYSTKQIYAVVRYNDPDYFNHTFKKCEGVNPSKYGERLENGTGRGQGIDMSICKKGTVGRIVCTLFVVLFTVLAASGCARTEDATVGSMGQEEPKVQTGFSFDLFVIEWWMRERDVFMSATKELGAEVNVQNANGDVQDQTLQIEYFIRKQVDVIVVVAGDREALADVIIKVRGAGIRTVPYDCLMQNTGYDLYTLLSNTETSRLIVRSLLESISDGGDIFLIQGSLTGHSVALVRGDTDKTLAGSSLSVVYKSNCADWAAGSAYTYTKKGLEQDRYVKGTIRGNDNLTSQALWVLSEERLAGEAYVTGQDGDLATCQRIVEGTQEMTAFKSAEQEASMTAKCAVLLRPEEEIEEARNTAYGGTYQVPYLELQPTAVIGENIDEVITKSRFHTKEDVYLNVN